MHHCHIHNIYWKTTPSRALQGFGCEMCRKDKFRKVRNKSHDEYVNSLAKINPNIEVIEKYSGARIPIKHYCKKHNLFWNVSPDSLLQGYGCLECGKEKVRDKNGKKHELYVDELKRINSDIIVVGTYINANTPILHKCLIDGYEWNARPANILSRKGCPKCANIIKRTHDKYIKEISLTNPNIEVLENYINSYTPILHKCKKHNIKWNVQPSSILQGYGCLECGKEKVRIARTKSHEQYVKELEEINPNIVAIEKYNGANIPILHKCLKDGNEWYAQPANTLFGTGCPLCNQSKGERKICLWLNKHHITYQTQKSFKDCKDIKPLPFDFYLPNHNIVIEYDGKQHYEPINYFGGNKRFEYIVRHDQIKNEYCKNNGISLLRIPYFKNVEEELNNFLFI